MDIQLVLGSNRLEDVNWLCSLSDSELVSSNFTCLVAEKLRESKKDICGPFSCFAPINQFSIAQ